MFYEKSVLRNFTKFTGKHLCQSLFYDKAAGLTPATLFKKETLAQVFSCEFCEISKNTFFTEYLLTPASIRFITTSENFLFQPIGEKMKFHLWFSDVFRRYRKNG